MLIRLRSLALILTGLVCLLGSDYAAAMYDPGTGRFLQRDPSGYPDGMNSYGAYHVMRGGVDPVGLDSIEINNRQFSVGEGGSIQNVGSLGVDFTWTISEVDAPRCRDNEVRIIEYDFDWYVGGGRGHGTLSPQTAHVLTGGYHVSVQSDTQKTGWRLNLGRGTGYFRSANDTYWRTEYLMRMHGLTVEELGALDENERLEVARNVNRNWRDYAQIRSDEEASSRQLHGSYGKASYTVKVYCYCRGLALALEGFNNPANISRQDVETATESSIPARFLTRSDPDPRSQSKWKMGGIIFSNIEHGGNTVREVGSASGEISFNFDRVNPNINEIRVSSP